MAMEDVMVVRVSEMAPHMAGSAYPKIKDTHSMSCAAAKWKAWKDSALMSLGRKKRRG